MADRSDQIAPRPPKLPKEVMGPGEVPPPPPKPVKTRSRSKAARNTMVVFLSGVFTLLTIGAVASALAVIAGRELYEQKGPLTEAKTVVIPQRASLDSIADTLAKAQVIENDFVMVWAARLTGQADRLKPGEYQFKPGMSTKEVTELIADGKTVQHAITFPEGWSSEQIIARLTADPVLAGKISAIPEEGSLMPDTYKFTRGDTRERIIDLMKRTQERRLQEIWSKRAEGLPLKTPRDLVILASIVEKETSKAEERPRVAAVFINRLKKNMRLETDPTILYGLYGGKAWTESRTITKADLAAPNPYNTYKIQGLPPGPIGNPGRAALEAVANPATTNELFFVADGTGGHAFAETFEEHTKNVQRWRQIEASRREASTVTVPNAQDAVVPGAGTGVQTNGGAPATGAVAPPSGAAAPPTGAVAPPATGQQRPPAAAAQRPAAGQPPRAGVQGAGSGTGAAGAAPAAGAPPAAARPPAAQIPPPPSTVRVN